MFSYLSTCRAFPDLKKIINSRSTDAFLRGLARAMSSKMFIELMGKLAGYEETMAGNICSIPVFAITAYTSYVGTQWWSNDPRELEAMWLIARLCTKLSYEYSMLFFEESLEATR